MTWKRIFVARAAENGEGDILYELHGERSDDAEFRIQFIAQRDAKVKDVVAQFINGLMDLDSYRECECTIEKACKQHNKVYNPFAPKQASKLVLM